MQWEVAVLAFGLACLVLGVASVAHARSQLSRLDYDVVPAWDDSLPSGAAEVLAALSSAVVVVDTAERVVKATAAAFALGLARDGRLHPDLAVIVRQVQVTGLAQERELELPRGGLAGGPGTTQLLDVRVVPLGSLHVLVLAEDRTEARRVEEVRRDFAANVSHELKTPVGAISLLSESLTVAADDPETVLRFASRLEKESARLSVLVQDIIDLSKLQSAAGLIRPELVSLDELAAETVDRVRTAADTKNIVIAVDVSSGLAVFGDHGLLRTAMGNLVENAVHYSEPGTRITVVMRRVANLVEIAVADEGIGISAVDTERVFERFFRVDKARSRATGGTGLGLSIVKHIAANHGGEVTVESELGRGSTFTLRLPAAPSERGANRPQATAVAAPRNPPRVAALRAARPARKAGA
ncbi:MAG: sensor histidine kinase [Actinomycetales bacterium]